MTETDQTAKVYPCIEIDNRGSQLEINYVDMDEKRTKIIDSNSVSIADLITQGRELLTYLKDESSELGDEVGNEFQIEKGVSAIEFPALILQLKQRIEKNEVAHLEKTTVGDGIYEQLLEFRDADLYMAFKHAIEQEVMKHVFNALRKHQEVENIIIFPGELEDLMIEWFNHDLIELGYDVQILFEEKS